MYIVVHPAHLPSDSGPQVLEVEMLADGAYELVEGRCARHEHRAKRLRSWACRDGL
eukprot:CAMPEP_0118928084 /NCGR_PEP_ID=MMETSP1169-20130426/5421_1 /TAXON_ID=36882 /ORGANISM="Pyramimonas obovata, Strain CCMP722" /LENGTH=55 /DNA_ID=CAMNT_0006869985 /DNA_START=260 /DNA_END=424 /DNA_ORIENTATION=+